MPNNSQGTSVAAARKVERWHLHRQPHNSDPSRSDVFTACIDLFKAAYVAAKVARDDTGGVSARGNCRGKTTKTSRHRLFAFPSSVERYGYTMFRERGRGWWGGGLQKKKKSPFFVVFLLKVKKSTVI